MPMIINEAEAETIVTFGYGTFSESTDINFDYIFATVAEAPNSGVAKSIKVYLDPTHSEQKWKGAIYEYVDEATNFCGAFLGGTYEYDFDGTEAEGWFEAEFEDTVYLHAGTKYYITYWYSVYLGNTMWTWRKSPAVNTTAYRQISYGAWPDPLTGEAVSSRTYGSLCTFVLNVGEPILSSPSPANESTEISITPTCSIDVVDLNGSTMDVCFYENTTGSWVLRENHSSVGNGTYTWNYTQATTPFTKYHWKVSADDGTYNTTAIYEFTTGSFGDEPTIEFVTPPSTTNSSKNNIGDDYIRAQFNSSSGNQTLIHNITHETLRPTSAWDSLYIDFTGNNDATYKCIDDTVPDNGEFPTFSGSFVYEAVNTSIANSTKWDTPNSLHDPSAIVDSLTYTITCGGYGVGASVPIEVYLALNISNTWYESTTYAGRILASSTWYTFNYTWYNNPATSTNWTVEDINNLFYGMRTNTSVEVGSVDTTQVYATLNGIEAHSHYTFTNLNDDVLVWMRFDDQTGTSQPQDISGYNNNGTLQYNAYIDNYGKYGKNLWTDGHQDYVSIASSSSMNTIDDTATVSLWARSYQNITEMPSTYTGLFGFYQNLNNACFVAIRTTNKLEFYNRMGSATIYAPITDSELPSNFIESWHLYTITFNSSYVTAYIDGEYKGRSLFSSTWPSLSSLADNFTTYVAKGWQDSVYNWYGDIDEFMIFNRQLSEEEILSLYNSSTNQFDHNFTGLGNGNFTFTGYVSNNAGSLNNTETRWANISIQYPPTISDAFPANNSEDQSPRTTCGFTVEDLNNDTLNIYWQENSTGAWVTRHTDLGVSAGDTVSYQYLVFNILSHKYYWRAYINDSYNNISTDIFDLTTSGNYFQITGLTDDHIDWDGIPDGYYWSNDTGNSETLNLTMEIGEDYTATDVGVWVGDLAITYIEDLTTGWNTIIFPEWAIDSCPSDTVEDVLDSVYDELYNVTEVSTGLYWNRLGGSTLTNIQYDETYNIYVNSSCTIRITSAFNVDASNISIQASSDNVTWGANTRTYIDGGSQITFNSTTWNNGNGCYGADPFGAGITNDTISIYFRFLLYVPPIVPSNFTYYSLTSDNWKIFIFSENITEDVPPPFNPASLPSSTYFTLKWTSPDLYISGYAQPVTKDVDGDGIHEIFYAGKNGSSTFNGNVVCINGSTGALNWRTSFSSAYVDPQHPVSVYDFDKDGEYEVILSCNTHTICYNALTGIVEWDVAVPSGWHYSAYIDNGADVFVYVSFHDSTEPYDAKVSKLNGKDGSIVAQTSTYYSCYGGVSIADMDGNGKYKIFVTDAGKEYSPTKPCKGLRCYDEDLNLLWYGEYPSCESHSAMLIDVDADGDLEAIIGRMNKSGSPMTFNNSGIYVYNHDGTIWNSQEEIANWHMHVQPAVGDLDGDGHIEMLDGSGSWFNIFDLTDWAIEYTYHPNAWTRVSEPPVIGNVIYDSGLLEDNVPEIISTNWDGRIHIIKYNTLTSTYQDLTNIAIEPMGSFVQDTDHDGYNEMLFYFTNANGSIRCYETFVPTYDPQQRTETSWGGERRLKSDAVYPRPYSGPTGAILGSVSFGGLSDVLPISAGTFISTCTSQHDLVEYNGFYNTGNYTTYLNTTIYQPAGWTLNHLRLRLYNGTTLYDTITNGYTITVVNSTFRRYSRLYNPSITMNDVYNIDIDVNVSLSFEGIELVLGNETFTDVFDLYHIEPPYNGSSIYNTTIQSVNMTWTAGNYTDRSVVIRKTGTTHPTTPTDGTVVQNDTITTYNESSVYTSRAYSIFGYNETSRSYSDPLYIPWGAIGVNCYNESNPSQALPFDLEVTNKAGTIVYKRTGLTNTHYIDVYDIPYGTNTIFIIESNGYRQRIYYKDITLNTFSNYSFYLPPTSTTGEGGGSGGNTTTDCTLRSFTNSITVSSYTSDAVIPLTHEIEDIITVEIYNSSLYGTYGGWILVPDGKYSTSSTQVTINQSALDKNTSMAKVIYYYNYCPGDITETPLYYIRVVETIETEYTEVDRGVEDAIVDIKRYVNTTGNYVSVAQLLTDANGYCNVYLIPGVLYKVLITKTGYDDKLSDYIPSPANQFGQTTEKIFRLIYNLSDVPIDEHDTLWTGITWSIEPTVFYHSTSFDIYFNISSSNSKIEWYDAYLYVYNYTNMSWILLDSDNDTTSTGGSISFNVPNITGKYSFICRFKKENHSMYTFGAADGCRFFFISLRPLQDAAMNIPDLVYLFVMIFLMIAATAFLVKFGAGAMSGIGALCVMGFMLALKPDLTIGSPAVSAWWMFLATCITYFIVLFLFRGRT